MKALLDGNLSNTAGIEECIEAAEALQKCMLSQVVHPCEYSLQSNLFQSVCSSCLTLHSLEYIERDVKVKARSLVSFVMQARFPTVRSSLTIQRVHLQ